MEAVKIMNGRLKLIEEKIDLIVKSFGLPTLFISPRGKVLYENLYGQTLNPIYENQKEKFFNPLNFDASKIYHFPVIRKSVIAEKYILISVMDKINDFIGTLIIGPCLAYPLSEDRINNIINDSKGFFIREKIMQYYKSLPIINSEKFFNISVVAFHLLNNQLLSTQTVLQYNAKISGENNHIEKARLEISKNLQTHVFHHDRLFEKETLNIIKEGRVDEIQNISGLKDEEAASILSKSSYLRSIKNHIITLITLVSREAIKGGLHEEIAFSLHDSFIQHLEELNRLDDVRSLARDVLYTYANKVKQVKNEKYSKTITICKDYIYKNIYEEINHDDIAEKINLHPKYLPALFKKEVGITVRQYIQRIKVEEAKKLLAYSTTPILEICFLLNYNDQSYFTKVFKKIAGITPKQYRERHHLMIENET